MEVFFLKTGKVRGVVVRLDKGLARMQSMVGLPATNGFTWISATMGSGEARRRLRREVPKQARLWVKAAQFLAPGGKIKGARSVKKLKL